MKKNLILLSILLVFLVAFSAYGLITFLNSNREIPFDRVGWNECLDDRWRMLDSLKEEYKIGMSKKETIDLLGEENYPDGNDKTFCYILSPGMTDLYIYFNDTDVAYKYNIYQY